MNADTVLLVISIILGLVCVPAGSFLAFVPMKADNMTSKQSKASQMLTFIIALVFIGLLLAGYDMPTYAIVIGLVIGFGLGKIPTIHAWAMRTWPFFEPKAESKRAKRR
ncbi:hypothetical protein BLEM_0584 [Bifidobacterium lemurum]|uniref:Uncharacterized protein n=1 Tax=Bifidobacterium lemurum TaxID=1603886 RepID=A0A261FU19_9BIFI|nr:hypothetical protein [Bifidobacterium lemurum]OZG62667.1 hypothetical protein BLEM_0584 [Bifidobacterium lemurum]QOL34613.1 hypothetical protein BL8807_01380 [Bifidobacterium lemurum]